MKNKKTAFEYEQLPHYKNDFPNEKDTRNCQIGAYNVVIERLIVEKEFTCSAFVVTGAGKTDIVRSIALGLKKRNYCSGCWAFSPSVDLRKQLQNDNIKEYYERIGEYHNPIPFVERDSVTHQPFVNNEVMESYTIQFLTTNGNVNLFIKMADKIIRNTGKPIVAIFDESHLCSTQNHWGEAAIKLMNAGVKIVLVTGTPLRSDSTEIPGFHTEVFSEEIIPFKNYVKSSDPAIINCIKGMKKQVKKYLYADYEYDYKKAWEDKIILEPEPAWIDGTAEIYKKYLSDMSQTQSERLLRRFLLDENTIEISVKKCIEELHTKKVSDLTCAAIVTTLSDDPNDENDEKEDLIGDLHAKKIQREFSKQAPHLKTLIVTSNNNDGGMRQFKDNNSYDILIVKTMGTIGYNCPRIKVVLCLSNHRQLAGFIQAANRGCRHFASLKNYRLIMPKDTGMQQLYAAFRDFTGLQVKEEEILNSSEEQIEINEKESSDEGIEKFKDHTVTHDECIRNEKDEIIELYNRKKPQMANILTDQQKLDDYVLMSNSLGKDWLSKMPDFNFSNIYDRLIDPNVEEFRLRGEANNLAKEITLEFISLACQKYDQHIYRNYTKQVWSYAKGKCGFMPNQKLTNLVGIKNYEKLINVFLKLKEKMTKEIPSNDFDVRHYLKRCA